MHTICMDKNYLKACLEKREIKLVLMMIHNRKIIFYVNVLHQMKQSMICEDLQETIHITNFTKVNLSAW